MNIGQPGLAFCSCGNGLIFICSSGASDGQAILIVARPLRYHVSALLACCLSDRRPWAKLGLECPLEVMQNIVGRECIDSIHILNLGIQQML